MPSQPDCNGQYRPLKCHGNGVRIIKAIILKKTWHHIYIVLTSVKISD